MPLACRRARLVDIERRLEGGQLPSQTRSIVLVSTELDALPMEEKTGLPYASKAMAILNSRETFVAHSCGHDIHMTAWLGTARTLVAMKDQWHGTLKFVAQPA